MSRHRAIAPTVRDPNATAADRSSLPDAVLRAVRGQSVLKQMSGVVLAYPHTAERLLTERRVPDAVVRYTLLAETAVRLDRARDGMVIAAAAARIAGQETPVEAGRLLPAATVLADATVLAGAPDAVHSCVDLSLLAGRYGDEHRAAIAAGLHAVAIFQQHSCREAIVLLDALGHAGADNEVIAAAGTAIDTINNCCARRDQPHWPPLTGPIVTCGGLVTAALTRAFFADRLQRWPGIHTCAPTPARLA